MVRFSLSFSYIVLDRNTKYQARGTSLPTAPPHPVSEVDVLWIDGGKDVKSPREEAWRLWASCLQHGATQNDLSREGAEQVITSA